MGRIKFENVTESLSVPSFYMAYRELGDKHKLWNKPLDELVDFFDSLSPKDVRRVLKAFGIRVILTEEDKAEFYAGGSPGLLLLDIPIPRDVLDNTGGRHVYLCPHCNRGVDAGWLDSAGLSVLATLYAAETAGRIKKSVVEFCMIQPIDISFPYSGKNHWHEADILRIMVENVLAEKLGLPEIVPADLSKQVTQKLADRLGFDIERWAETRARNIRQGIEPEPDFYGYKQVDEGGEL